MGVWGQCAQETKSDANNRRTGFALQHEVRKDEFGLEDIDAFFNDDEEDEETPGEPQELPKGNDRQEPPRPAFTIQGGPNDSSSDMDVEANDRRTSTQAVEHENVRTDMPPPPAPIAKAVRRQTMPAKTSSDNISERAADRRRTMAEIGRTGESGLSADVPSPETRRRAPSLANLSSVTNASTALNVSRLFGGDKSPVLESDDDVDAFDRQSLVERGAFRDASFNISLASANATLDDGVLGGEDQPREEDAGAVSDVSRKSVIHGEEESDYGSNDSGDVSGEPGAEAQPQVQHEVARETEPEQVREPEQVTRDTPNVGHSPAPLGGPPVGDSPPEEPAPELDTEVSTRAEPTQISDSEDEHASGESRAVEGSRPVLNEYDDMEASQSERMTEHSVVDNGESIQDSEPEIYDDDNDVVETHFSGGDDNGVDFDDDQDVAGTNFDDDHDVVETQFGNAEDDDDGNDDDRRSESPMQTAYQSTPHGSTRESMGQSVSRSLNNSLDPSLADFTPVSRGGSFNASTPVTVTPARSKRPSGAAKRRRPRSSLVESETSRLSLAGMETVASDFGPDFGGESYHLGDASLFAGNDDDDDYDNDPDVTANMTTLSDEDEAITPRPSLLSIDANDAASRGLRRSQRARIAPLKYWENEHAVYHLDEKTDMPVMVDVVHAIPQPTPKRRRQRTQAKNAPRKKQRLADLEEEEDDAVVVNAPPTVEAPVFQYPDMDERVERLIALSRDSMEFERAKPDDKYAVATLFDEDWHFTASGVMRLDVGGSKPLKPSRQNAYVFYVISGAVEVNISDNVFQVGRGGSFEIPRGNFYSITNLHSNETRLFFVQTTDTLSNHELKSSERSQASSRSSSVHTVAPSVAAN